MFSSKDIPHLPKKHKRGGKLWDKALKDLQDKMFTFYLQGEDIKFICVLSWILGWQARRKDEENKGR